MLKRDLLEKPYDIMNDILVYLYNHGGSATKDVLCQNLQITSNTLLEYLELLQEFIKQEDLERDLEVIEAHDQIIFKKDAKFPLKVCYLRFLEHSTKFQILRHVYHHGFINGPVFQDRIGISTATYYRRVAELNDLLKEFRISLKRGRMTGEENQIRFFYFCYFWFLKENKGDFSKEVNQQYNSLIQALSEELDIHFDAMEILQIKMWMKISFTRLNQTRECHFSKEFEQKERPLYEVINTVFYRYMKSFDRPYTLYEGLMFYDFFCSMRNFSPYSPFAFRLAKQQQDEKTYLDYQNRKVFDYLQTMGYLPTGFPIKRIHLLAHYLYQYHSHLYYFDGFIMNFDSWGIHPTIANLSDPLKEEDIHEFMLFCQKEFLPADPYKRYQSLLSEINYASILNMAQELTSEKIRIEVYHSINPFLSSLTIQMLKNTLGTKYDLELMLYDEEVSSDILLTNIHADSFETQGNYYYVFSDCCSTYDVKEVEKLIQQVIADRFLHNSCPP